MKLKMSSGTLSGLEDQVVTHKQGLLIYIQFVPFATLHVSFQAFQGCTKNRREDYHFSCLWPLLKRCTQVKITERHRSGQLFESFFFFCFFVAQSWMGCMSFQSVFCCASSLCLKDFLWIISTFMNDQHVAERVISFFLSPFFFRPVNQASHVKP